MRRLSKLIILFLWLDFIFYISPSPFQIFRRIKQSSYIELIKTAPKFNNLADCFTWWQTFIGPELAFHEVIKELAKENKIPQSQKVIWYSSALILSSIIMPNSLNEEEKKLLKEMDKHIEEGLKGVLGRLNKIDEAILSGIMEGFQEAMMPRRIEGMVLGEALVPELNQRLKEALRSKSDRFKKSVILDVLSYLVDCAKGTKQRYKQEWAKIVKEVLDKVMEEISRGEVRIDDMNRIKELIKEKIKEEAEERLDIQMGAVRADLEDVMDEIYINPMIQRNFPFLPLLVKAILSSNPSLLLDSNIQAKIMEYIQEGLDRSWVNEIVGEAKAYYKNSIAVSPILKIYLISSLVEELFRQNEGLREEIEKYMEVGK